MSLEDKEFTLGIVYLNKKTNESKTATTDEYNDIQDNLTKWINDESALSAQERSTALQEVGRVRSNVEQRVDTIIEKFKMVKLDTVNDPEKILVKLKADDPSLFVVGPEAAAATIVAQSIWGASVIPIGGAVIIIGLFILAAVFLIRRIMPGGPSGPSGPSGPNGGPGPGLPPFDPGPGKVIKS